MIRIPCINISKLSNGEHKSVMYNCIAVYGAVLKLVFKKYPCTRIFAMEVGNCKVEDCDKGEIFIPLAAVGTWQIAIFCS